MSQSHGFLYAPPPAGARMFGGTQRKILCPSRDWTEFLPRFEKQNLKYFDSMACVSFSGLNNLEIIYKKKYGIEVDFEDHFTAVASGTTRSGNYFYKVGDSVCQYDGLVKQGSWPLDELWKEWGDFYTAIPDSIRKEGKDYLNQADISYEWVQADRDVMYESLLYGPLQVGWFFGRPDPDGSYPRYKETANHALTLFKAEYGKFWWLYDHYSDFPIKRVAWDSLFWGAILWDITLKDMSNIKILKKRDAKDVGFWIPATDEAAFRSLCYALGKPLELIKKENSSSALIDWEKMTDGEFSLKP